MAPRPRAAGGSTSVERVRAKTKEGYMVSKNQLGRRGRARPGILALTALLAAGSLHGQARAQSTFEPTAAEKAQLELLSRPAAWFETQLKSPPTIVDGQRLDPKVQYILEQSRPFETPEAEAREQAVFATPEGRALVRKAVDRHWTLRTKITAPMAKVEDRQIPGRAGGLHVRIYTPAGSAEGARPVLVYFHGGGWIFGSVEGSDRATRLIANEAQAIVVSVDYRLSPEAVYPAASDDGEDAFLWVRANAAALGGDPKLVAVGGDSAGGHIAINVAQRQVLAGRPPPALEILYYPATDSDTTYESYAKFGKGYGLNKSFGDFVVPLAFGKADPSDGLVAPLRAKSLKGMPPTILVTPGFDILRDPSWAFGRRLEADGVRVTYLDYPSLTHNFLQQSGVVEAADHAATQSARLFGAMIRGQEAVVKGARP
jgi:acetyl esterase